MAKKGELVSPVTNNNSSGVASVILGILSIVFGLTVFVGTLAGLVTGFIGMFFAISQIRSNKNKWSTAGLILSIVGILFNIVVIILLVSLIFQVIQQLQALSSSGLIN